MRSSTYEEKENRSRPVLSLRFGPPRIIVEPGEHGGFAVTSRPSRAFPSAYFRIAGDALDYAELLAGEFGGEVLDRTGVAG